MIKIILKKSLFIICLVFLGIYQQTLAATITVTNTNDSNAGSLRQAITDASPGDDIDFSVTGTITLSSQLSISKNLTINGPGASQLTISGGNSSRVIEVSATVEINNLSIINGFVSNYGAGIENNLGTLTINNCFFSGNQVTGSGSGGAVDNYNGTVQITNSVFSGNTAADRGGAVGSYNGSITIENCTLENNNADMGAAIGQYQSTGSLTVTNCTISNNQSADIGGGIYWYDGNVNIKNSTLSGNSATNQGGAYSDGTANNTININSCTIVNNSATNGGGINLRTATVNMKNTILANNTASTGANLNTSGSGSLNSQGYNLCNGVLASLTGTGDIQSGTLNIGTLANNGGSTKTHALLTGSAAINAIPEGGNSYNGVYPTDQRGYSRPCGTNADIGAFELIAAPTSQATDVTFSNLTAASATISWTRGDGANCAVFMAATSSGTASPVDNSTYTANTTFGSGSQIGSSGWYCIYNGPGTSESVSGLAPGTTYRIHVCEYNQGAGSELYLTGSETGNPNNVTTNSATITFTNGSGFSPVVSQGSTDQALGRFQLTGDVAGADLTAASIQLNGTRTGLSNLKLWSSTDATFESGADTQLGATVVSDPGDENSASFSGFTSAISTGGVYYFLTGDVSGAATGVVQGVLVNDASLTLSNGTLASSISNGPLSGGDASLPVELVAFNATPKNSAVELTWATASEIDNLGFIIERKTDKSDWQQIASYQSNNALVGKGTASSSSQYSYSDTDVTAGMDYDYRLFQVSTTGLKSVISTTAVDMSAIPTTTQLFAAYPNPFNPTTMIKYQLAIDSHMTLAVYDILGRQIKMLADQHQAAGEYTIQWDGSTDSGVTVASGTYLVKMQANGFNQIQKILLIK